jgi:hypothetical protein
MGTRNPIEFYSIRASLRTIFFHEISILPRENELISL